MVKSSKEEQIRLRIEKLMLSYYVKLHGGLYKKPSSVSPSKQCISRRLLITTSNNERMKLRKQSSFENTNKVKKLKKLTWSWENTDLSNK